jgi:endoglucanase
VASTADASRWLRIAQGLLERPTAPCLEHGPADHVRAFAKRRPSLALAEDRWGNLVVKWPGRGAAGVAPLVLVAHLDHPGFVVDRVEGKRARLTFRGGVRLAHAKRGTPLEFFRAGSSRPTGRGRLASASSRGARRAGSLGSATCEITSGTAVEGGFTMWAFPGFARRGSRIYSRCLDDLLGAASILATLDEMHRRRPGSAQVWGLFTRAEEIGLLGALAAIEAGTVPREATVISLETSRALPHARAGDGVIVRVGDVRSVFDPRVTAALAGVASELSGEDRAFRFQRRLMDGGTCEATAFCAAGFRSGGLALPLGNYHNMKGLDGGPRGIGPEFVRISDFVSAIELLVRVGESSGRLTELESRSQAWIEPATRQAREVLAATPLGARGPG